MDNILEEYRKELDALFVKFQKADTILACIFAVANVVLFIILKVKGIL